VGVAAPKLRSFVLTQIRCDHRVDFALGGASPDPLARAGFPSMNRLQPLAPDTRSKKP